jgi:hypothetical protein
MVISCQQMSLSGIWLVAVLLNNPEKRELAIARLGYLGLASRSMIWGMILKKVD